MTFISYRWICFPHSWQWHQALCIFVIFWQLTVITSTHQNPERQNVQQAFLWKVEICVDAPMCLKKVLNLPLKVKYLDLINSRRIVSGHWHTTCNYKVKQRLAGWCQCHFTVFVGTWCISSAAPFKLRLKLLGEAVCLERGLNQYRKTREWNLHTNQHSNLLSARSRFHPVCFILFNKHQLGLRLGWNNLSWFS